MPNINILLDIKLSQIQVGQGKYKVNVYLDEELAFTLEECYNDYTDALEAVKQRIKGE